MTDFTRTYAEYLADTKPYSAADTYTIADTSAVFQALTPADFTLFGTNNVDFLDATDDVLALTAAQATALAGTAVSLTAADAVTIFDTGTAIAGISATDIASLATKFVDVLDASDTLSLSYPQYQALGTIALTSGDLVTVTPTISEFNGLTASDFTTFGTRLVDVLDIDGSGLNAAVSISAAKAAALVDTAGLSIAAGDIVTLSDTGANIAGLSASQFGLLGGRGIDFIDASNDVLTLNAAQATALAGTSTTLTAGDTVTIFDTGAAIAGISATNIGLLATKGVDFLDASDNVLSLSYPQYQALGTIALTTGDVVTVTPTTSEFNGLTAGDFTTFGTRLVDVLDIDGATNSAVSISTAKAAALVDTAGLSIAAGDSVTLADTGGNIAGLSASQFGLLGGRGIDFIDASNDVLTLNAAQATALAGTTTTLTAGDSVMIFDTGTAIAGISAANLASLATKGVDFLDSSDNTLSLSYPQYQALGTIALTATDSVTVTPTTGEFNGLGASDFTTFGTRLVDVLDIDGSGISATVSISAAKASALVNTAGLSIAAGDIVTLADSSANIAALTASQIGLFSTRGIDIIDAIGDVLALTAAQATALAGTAVALTAGDVVTIFDSGAAIAGISAANIATLATRGVDFLDASDNVLSLSYPQYQALGTIALTTGDVVTVTPTTSEFNGLTASDFTTFGTRLVDVLDIDGATNSAVSISTAKAAALVNTAGLSIAAGDSVTLADTGGNIAGLSASQFGLLGGRGIDFIDASNDVLTLNAAQATALAGTTTTLTAGDSVTIFDTGTAIAGISAANLASLATKGVDFLDSSDNTLSLSYLQYQALGTIALTATDSVTVTPTTGEFNGLGASDFTTFGTRLVDVLDIDGSGTSATVSISAAKAAALVNTAGLSIAAGDIVTLADSGANIAALTASQIGLFSTRGIDTIDATGDVLALTAAQATALAGTAVALTVGDIVTIFDTGAAIAGISTASIAILATRGVDFLDASDDTLSLSYPQYQALGTIGLTSGDLVTVTPTTSEFNGLTVGDFTTFGTRLVDVLDIDGAGSSAAVSISAAKAAALVNTAGLSIAAGDIVTLADTGANIAGLSASQIGLLGGRGVDIIDASNNALTLNAAQATALAGTTTTLTAGDSVTIFDTGTAIAGISATNFGILATRGVDFLDASDDTLSLFYAQYQALGTTIALTAGDSVTVTLTTGEFNLLTASDFTTFGTRLVDVLDIDGSGINAAVSISAATAAALVNTTGLSIAASDIVTLADLGANIATLTSTQFGLLAARGVDKIDASNDVLSLTVAQYLALVATATTLATGDTVTLADTGSAIAGLTPTQFGALAANGIDIIDATGDVLALTAAQATALAGTTVLLTAGDIVTIFDAGAAIAGISAANIAILSTRGVDFLDASDNTLSLSYPQYQALGTIALTSGDLVTVTPTSSEFNGLTAGDFTTFGTRLIDVLDIDGAINSAVSISAAKAGALVNTAGVSIAAGDIVTLADSGANIAGLSASQFGLLGGRGVDSINANDDVLALTAAQATALAGTTTTLTAADTVTIFDTGTAIAGISAANIAILATRGVDFLDSSDNTLSLSYPQYQALGTIQLTAGDTVTVAPTASEFNSLTASDFTTFGTRLVDVLDIDGSGVNAAVSISEAKAAALVNTTGLSIAAGDSVTLADLGANIAALTSTQFGLLAARGVDKIDATDGSLSLTVAQYLALVATATTLTLADTVTLADSGSAIAGLTSTQFGALATNGIDVIDTNDNVLTLTFAQYSGLGTVLLTPGDAVTVTPTTSEFNGLTAGDFTTFGTRLVDVLDVDAGTNSAVSISAAKAAALVNTAGLSIAAGDIVTLSDTGGAIAGLSASQIGLLGARGIDIIDASDNVLTLNAAQATALAGTTTTLTVGDSVTILDTGAAIAGISAANLGILATRGVDFLDANDGTLTLTVVQYQALGTIALTAADTVTLADTGAAIAALTAGAIGLLAGKNVDRIDATDDTLTLSLGQYQALGTGMLTAGDAVTVAPTSAEFATLTAANFTSFGTNLVDVIDVDGSGTNSSVSISAAIAAALIAAPGLTIAGGDSVTLLDTGANIAALSSTQLGLLAAHGVDKIDASNDALSLNVAQYSALIATSTTLTAADNVTLADSGTALAALTSGQLGALTGNNVDKIDATDDLLSLNVAQYLALVATTTTLTTTDFVTLKDTGAAIAGLTAGQFGALAGNGIDKIDAIDDALSLTVARYTALVATSTTMLTAADVVTLFDTGANIATLTSVQFGVLGANGIDHIDASDNILTLTLQQYQALNGVPLTGGDTVTVALTTAEFNALTAGSFTSFGTNLVDVLDIDGSGTNSAASINAAKAAALVNTAGLSIAANDIITLSDTGVNIALLTASQLGLLSSRGVDFIDASDDLLSLTVAQYLAILANSTTPAPGDNVTLADLSINISSLTASQLGALAGNNIDTIDATDNVLTLTVAQYLAIAATTTTLAPLDFVTLGDAGANIAGLTSTQFAALAGKGIDRIDANDNALTITFAQFNALGAVALTSTDSVTVTLTSAEFNALTSGNLTTIGTKFVDILDVDGAGTNASVTITAAKAAALATSGVAIAAGDIVTLLDSGPAIGGLTATQLGLLGARGVDVIDVSNDILSLTAAQALALLGTGVALTGADTITLTDSSGNIAAISVANITALAAAGIDIVDATDNVLSLTVAQYQALGTIALTPADIVTLADTGANIAALTNGAIGLLGARGIDKIDATDNTLALTYQQYLALGSVLLTGGDLVTVMPTSAEFSALSAADFTAFGTNLADVIDVDGSGTNSSVSIDAARAAALVATAGVSIAVNDVVTLSDTGANIAALTATQIGLLGARGVDFIDAGDNALTLTLQQYLALGSTALTAGDLVTVTLTSAEFASLAPADFTTFAALLVDVLDVDGTGTNAAVAINAARAAALVATAGLSIAAGDIVTLSDSGTNIASLSSTQIGLLAAHGVDKIDASNDILALTLAQYQALNSVTLTDADVVTLADTGSTIATLSAAQVGALAGSGIDRIDATDNTLTLTLQQYLQLGSVGLAAADLVTVSLTGGEFASLVPGDFTTFGTKLVDVLDVDGSATNSSVSISVAGAAALIATSSLSIAANDIVTLSDTGANIAGLLSAQIGLLASRGVDRIDASDNALSLTVAQYQALGSVALTVADNVTLADSGANLSALSSAAFGALAASNIDTIDATDNVLRLSYAQYLALGSTALTGADAVTVDLTSAQFTALAASDFTTFGTNLVDVLDVDGAGVSANVSINVTKAAALVATTGLSVASADVLTLSDSGANIAGLSPAQIGLLGARGVDSIDATDDTLTISYAQYQALGTVSLTSADAVTVTVSSGAQFNALTAADFTTFGSKLVDTVDVDGGANASVSISAAIAAAMVATGGPSIASGDTVTLSDTSANIDGLTASQIGLLGSRGIDAIDATDDILKFNVAQSLALVATAVTLSVSDTVTVLDSGANLATLTVANLTALSSAGFDALDANDDSLSLTVAQYQALGTIALTPSDFVTLADSGAAVAALTPGQIGALAGAGIDKIDTTDNALTLTLQQYQQLGVVLLTTSDLVTVTLSSAEFALLVPSDFTTFGSKLVDVLDVDGAATNSSVSVTAAQAAALVATTGLSIAINDVVTLSDTGANIAALTAVQIGLLGPRGVDRIDASDGQLALTAAQYLALGSVALTASDDVTLLDSGANIAALSSTTIGGMGAANIDRIDANDDALNLSYAQYLVLGTVLLTGGDAVTVTLSSSQFAGLTAADFTSFGTNLVDFLDVDGAGVNASVSVDAAKAAALVATAGLSIASADIVTLADTGANIAGLSSTQIGLLAGRGVDSIDASDNVLTLSYAQYQSLGVVTLTAIDTVTVTVTSGAQFNGLVASDFTAFGTRRVDIIDVDGAANTSVSISAAIAAAMVATGGPSIAAGDIVTLNDTGANIAALTASQIGLLGAHGIDFIDASDNVLTLNAAQAAALAGTATTLTAADDVTLLDSGANIAALSSTTISGLAAANFDRIDANNDVLNLSYAQYLVLGTVLLTGGDAVTVTLSSSQFAGLTAADFTGFGTNLVDFLDVDGAGVNASVSVDAAKAAALVATTGLSIASADIVTLADTGANIAGLTSTQIGLLAGRGIDAIDASDNVLTLSYAQYQSLGTVTLTTADTVTVTVTSGVQFNGLVASDFTAFGTKRVDIIDVDGAANTSVSISAAIAAAMVATGGPSIAAGDTVTLSDTGANIAALTAVQIGLLASRGVDRIDANNDLLALTAAQYLALGTVALTAGDDVALLDSGANIAALSSTTISGLAAANIDRIDANNDVLNLSYAQYLVLGGVLLTGGDAVTVTLSSSQFAGLTAADFTSFGTNLVDFLDVDGAGVNASVSVDAAKAAALVATTGLSIASADIVTLADTGANIAGLTSTQIGLLAGRGVDSIDASDNALMLSYAQYQSLGTVALTLADTVTVTVTSGAQFNGLVASDFTAFGTKRVDIIDVDGAANTSVSISAAIAAAMVAAGGPSIATGDTVTLNDTGANIAALTASQFGLLSARGIDIVDASDNVLTLNVAQATALAGTATTLTAGDTVTIFDTGTAIAGISAANIAILSTKGVDFLDASNNALSLTPSQFLALGSVSLTAADTVTINVAASASITGSLATIDVISLGSGVALTTANTQFVGNAVSVTGGAGVQSLIVNGGSTNLSNVTFVNWTNNTDTIQINGAGTPDTLIGSNRMDVIIGGSGADTLNGLGGLDVLTGGMGADIFVFDATALAQAQAQSDSFDRITDYDQSGGAFIFSEGDQFDFSAILSSAYNLGSGQTVDSLVRVIASGTGANLQVDVDGTANGANWVTVARLDGIHDGDSVNVILDSSLPAGTAITVLPPREENDFDGDGRSDILLQHSAGTPFLWEMNGLQIKAGGIPSPVNSDWHIIDSTADFDGDGKSDILLRHDSGALFVWEMDGLKIKAGGSPGPVGADWKVASTADFDGDGKSDILLRHDSGALYLFEMNGTQIKDSGTPFPVDNHWQMASTADFDGDGKADILLRHESGALYLFEMNGTQIKASGTPFPVDNHWQVASTADFDGDGKADMLMRHESGGLYVIEMDGLQVKASGSPGPVNKDWKVASTADFDGDGKSDILLRHDSGALYLFEMNGTQIKASGTPFPVDNHWQIANTADYDGDGKADILLRHESGALYLIEMDGLQVKAGGSPAPVDNLWHIV